jgi:hypothetical protein
MPVVAVVQQHVERIFRQRFDHYFFKIKITVGNRKSHSIG